MRRKRLRNKRSTSYDTGEAIDRNQQTRDQPEPCSIAQLSAAAAPYDLSFAELGGRWFVYPSDGGVEASMPDTPINFDRSFGRGTRGDSSDSPVPPGLVLAAVLAVLFLFGPRVFDFVKDSANISTQQASVEAPTTRETKTP